MHKIIWLVSLQIFVWLKVLILTEKKPALKFTLYALEPGPCHWCDERSAKLPPSLSLVLLQTRGHSQLFVAHLRVLGTNPSWSTQRMDTCENTIVPLTLKPWQWLLSTHSYFKKLNSFVLRTQFVHLSRPLFRSLCWTVVNICSRLWWNSLGFELSPWQDHKGMDMQSVIQARQFSSDHKAGTWDGYHPQAKCTEY